MLSRVASRSVVRALCFLALMLFLVSAAQAQSAGDTLSLTAGTRIRVHGGASSAVLGELLRVTPDSLVFREQLSRTRWALARPQVRMLERSVGHPGIRSGAAKMAIIAGALGAVVGYTLSDYDDCVDGSCRPSRVGMTLGFGAVSAAVGALTVGILTPERWETVLDQRTR